MCPMMDRHMLATVHHQSTLILRTVGILAATLRSVFAEAGMLHH